MAVYHIHVGSCQSECVYTLGLQLGYKVLVDQASIDHGYHLQHLCVGDASAIHHFALYTQGCCYFSSASASAVYQYFLSWYGGKICKELCQLLVVLNDGAAHLYDCYFLHICLYFDNDSTKLQLFLLKTYTYSRLFCFFNSTMCLYLCEKLYFCTIAKANE